MEYKPTHMKFVQKASIAGRVALIGLFMSAHLAFGTPKIMTHCKTPVPIEAYVSKSSPQDFGLTEAQKERVFNSLSIGQQQMISNLRSYMSDQFRREGLYEDARNITNLEIVWSLYALQNDPELAPVIKTPAMTKNLMDLLVSMLNGKISASPNSEEKQELEMQLRKTRIMSNFFGKLAVYPSSQYNNLMDAIKTKGDAELGR